MDTLPAKPQHRAEVDVAIAGAGPTGLMLANLLGTYGVTAAVLESGPALIDFPRGVGMDDETMRTFQAVGLVDEVLQHTVPHQRLVFVDRRHRALAEIAPPVSEFGWPRRSGFVQPLADRVLLEGLSRFPHVRVEWGTKVTSFVQDSSGVAVQVDRGGVGGVLKARFLVGSDGGRSDVRKALGFGFEGTSSAADWLVIDMRNDPLGRPGAFVGADPRRPYACISIPHGIRRFEFMLNKGEGEREAQDNTFIADLLRPFVHSLNPDDIIRRRVYTHHSRIAERFRDHRVFVAGDAAHVMPVWQGQGYNSAIRDANNLAWKLAAALDGLGGEELLDSYELERREHAQAMIRLSTWVGRVVSVRSRTVATLRDTLLRAASAVPAVKRYIVQMRFKPMPTLDRGALTLEGSVSSPTPVGKIFVQPTVSTRHQSSAPLDDVIGPWFALIVWNNDPSAILSTEALATLARLDVRLLWARPETQLGWKAPSESEEARILGDTDGTLKNWFDQRQESVVLVRPDRIIAGASDAQSASHMVASFAAALGGRSFDRDL